MRAFMWIVVAVAAVSEIGGYQIDGRMAATLARKLRPKNCKRGFHFDAYSLPRMVFTYLVWPRP